MSRESSVQYESTEEVPGIVISESGDTFTRSMPRFSAFVWSSAPDGEDWEEILEAESEMLEVAASN